MKSLKVAHIIPNLKMGGAERLCIDIVSCLKKKGVQVLLILLENEIEYNVELEGVELHVTSSSVALNPFKSKANRLDDLKNKILEFSPDLVHTHLFTAEFLWKSTKLEIPTIFHIHDNIKVFNPFANGLKSKKSWVNVLEKVTYKKLLKKQKTKFLCISKDTQNYIQNKIDNKGKQSFLLHNAIDFKRFSYTEPRILDEIRIVSIGSLVPKKSQIFIVEVVEEIKNISPKNVSLVLLGDGPERHRIEQFISGKNLKDFVILKGKVNNTEDFIKEANIYIHGAYEEPFGLVLLEAMAGSLPVFSTNGGGNKDIVKTGVNGYFADHRDPKKMAEEVVKLFNSSEEYLRLSEEAHRFALDYDITTYIEKLLDIYKTQISG